MERNDLGVVNAYILNLMTHADTLRMDECDIRNRIEKHFKRKNKNPDLSDQRKRNKRMRPQNVRKFHLDPLVKKRWLRKLPDGRYERVGELRRVMPRETLVDQFEYMFDKDLPDREMFIDSYIYDKEFNRNHFGAENFEDSLTEEEYDRYMDQLYKKYIE